MLRRIPPRTRWPTMRTVGNGCRTPCGGLLMRIVSATTDDWWSAAVTRRRTTWSAGVENTALVVGPPGWNGPKGPLSATSHAYPTIALVRSEDVDTSENLSPTRGEEGNHRIDATGGALSVYVAAGDVSSARNGPASLSPSVPVRKARLATPSDAVLDFRGRTAFRIHLYPK